MTTSFTEKVLMPGDFCFLDRNTRLRTLLGSCVAITLWHPTLRIGGMCHYMLPSRGKPSSVALDGRYADEAMQLFLAKIAAYGTRPEEFDVKVFGGGHMFPVRDEACIRHDQAGTHCAKCLNVACRNRQAAYFETRRHGFVVANADLGGMDYRHVALDLADGSIMVRRTPVVHSRGRLEVTGS